MLNVFSSGSYPSRKMHIPKKTPPTRRSTVSDSWVLLPDAVSIGNHTEQRSPQLNGDNMSSHQFADASAHGLPNNNSSSGGASSSSPSPELSFEDYHYHHHHLNTAAPFVPPFFPRKPESNGGSSSTETAGTDDTLVIDLDHHYPLTNPTFHPAAAMPPFPHEYDEHTAGSYRYHHHQQLTQSNMDLHQHDLALRYTSSIPGWVAAAGTGRRLLPSPPCSSVAPSGGSLYMYMDMDMDMDMDVNVDVDMAAGGGSVVGMGGGDVGGTQPAAAVAAAAGEEGMAMVAAAGAWCEGALGPVMVMRLMEEVEEEWFL